MKVVRGCRAKKKANNNNIRGDAEDLSSNDQIEKFLIPRHDAKIMQKIQAKLSVGGQTRNLKTKTRTTVHETDRRQQQGAHGAKQRSHPVRPRRRPASKIFEATYSVFARHLDAVCRVICPVRSPLRSRGRVRRASAASVRRGGVPAAAAGGASSSVPGRIRLKALSSVRSVRHD